MIEQISSVMTGKQIDAIANLIREQFYKYRNYIKSQAYQDLFPEEYKPHKEAHTVSWAITGAFPSGKIVFSVKKNWLESLDLCLPDEAGTVVAQEQLFVIPHIVVDSA